jgi:hypothetical protein
MASSPDPGLAAMGRGGGGDREGACLVGFMQRGGMPGSLGDAAMEFLKVLAGQALIGAWPGRLAGTAGKYSNWCGSGRTGVHALGR